MNRPGVRYTLRGGAEVEARIAATLCEIRDIASGVAAPGELRALALIGGYGRGEGGVVRTPAGERAHNNLDLLLIMRGDDRGRREALRSRLSEAVAPVAARDAIGIDVGATSDTVLARSPALVMWHDMRFGHRTILGDADYLPSLARFTPEAIPDWDIRNLLVNRGTLLVINDLLLEGGRRRDADLRPIVRHAVKAIIGYGDALLHAEGQYHWSYAEKQRRMRACAAAPESFRRAYDEASEFRFEPDYERFAGRDLANWLAEVRQELAPIHLRCESRRLGQPGLTWGAYLDAALATQVREAAGSVRGAARAARSLLRSRPARGLSPAAQAGWLLGGMRGALPCVYPAVCYPFVDAGYRERAAGLLGAADATAESLRRAYLGHWQTHGDINLGAALERLGAPSIGAPMVAQASA